MPLNHGVCTCIHTGFACIIYHTRVHWLLRDKIEATTSTFKRRQRPNMPMLKYGTATSTWTVLCANGASSPYCVWVCKTDWPNTHKAVEEQVSFKEVCNWIQQFATSFIAMGTHKTCGITQCHLPPGRADVPALTPAAKLVLDLATRQWCKADLT